MAQQPSPEARVATIGRVVRDEVAQLTAALRELDESDLEAPSACAGWAVKDVAAHMAESNDRFQQIVQAALAGATPPEFTPALRAERQAAVRARPGRAVADQLEQRVATIFEQLELASAEDLARTVTVPAGTLSLVQVAGQRLSEVALHSWDIRSATDAGATLNPDAVPLLLDSVLAGVPRLANRGALQGRNAVYHLELSGAGGGPVTLELRDGAARAARGAPDRPAATLRLPAEAAIRLLWGRLDLERAVAAGTVHVEGDRAAALALGEVFRGV